MPQNEQALPVLTIDAGHSKLAGGGAVVQLGATCALRVDITLEAVIDEALTEWLRRNSGFFTEEQFLKLVNEINSGFAATAVLGALGYVAANGDHDHFQNVEHLRLRASSVNEARFFESFHALTAAKVRAERDIEVHGTSMTPTRVSVFARIVEIGLEDGRVLAFVNWSDPVAADSTGDTSGVRTRTGQRLGVSRVHPGT
jgi:hypothetical protein